MKSINNDITISQKQYLNLQIVKRYVGPLMKQLDGLDYYFYGGCIRDVYMGITPNDIDLGTHNKEHLDLITARLQKCGYHLDVITPYGYKMNYLNASIDLSNWQTLQVSEKISDFDFTINTIALTSKYEFIFHRTTLDDIDNRILKEIIKDGGNHRPDIHGRTTKFYSRGFTHHNLPHIPSVNVELVSTYIQDVEWAEREFDLRIRT